MDSCFPARVLVTALLGVCLAAGPARAQTGREALDLLVGSWDVSVETVAPQPGKLTYAETYRWILDGKFLRGQTRDRSDGLEEIIFGTYDEQKQGYPFWIFSSGGTYIYLEPATWDPRSRTMEWRSPPGFDIWYHTKVVFPGDGTRHWTVLIKDWKGTVLLQQRGQAVRRRD